MSQETAFKVWLENKREGDEWNAENLSNPEYKYRYSKRMDSFDDLTEEQFQASGMANGGFGIDFPDDNGEAFAGASVGNPAYQLVTKVSDVYTKKQMESWLGGANFKGDEKIKAPCKEIVIDHEGEDNELATICDWSPFIPPAENQGNTCASCYAFGAVYAAEGALAAVTREKISLSKMQVLSTPWYTTGPSSVGDCPKACPAPACPPLDRCSTGFFYQQRQGLLHSVPKEPRLRQVGTAMHQRVHVQQPLLQRR